MNSDMLINNLAALLIITSLLVIAVNNSKAVTFWYAIQSLVLVSTFLAIAYKFDATELYEWSVTSFVTKVIILPALMYYSFRQMRDKASEKPAIHLVWILMIAGVVVGVCCYAVKNVNLPLIEGLRPVLAVSLAHFFLGILCIVSQRNILKQLFGYCLMENGSSLTLALLANKAPGLVEIGISMDALFAVIFMIILVRQIYTKLQTLDVQELISLKG
ncbi:hydrogenase 4 membrane subunit [Psychromonas sp. CD1]|uniref:hydrogenase 4 membrane subunit n=1 Tax=Psychromonas sp. CD1 TaxID=1979839 RepID=UPI000B9A4F97|nr:hydrogenase 4 membrane subunit [Psychromonas sp. CD1]